MKILFIYPDLSSSVGCSAGITILSAVLKRAGHTTRLLHIAEELDYPLDPERIKRDVRELDPGLICFSVSTNQWPFAREIGKAIREETDVPTIVGGAHASAVPDTVMAEPWVDMVCRGEGDLALPAVVDRLEAGRWVEGIANLIYRQNGRLVREPLGEWVSDLDSLPFEDFGIFDYGRIIDTRTGWAEVIVTRGCPFPCSYCFNRPLFNAYAKEIRESCGREPKKRDFCRRRSAPRVIEMLEELKSSYPNVKGITFVDDVLAMEGEWLREFTDMYSKQVGLPYACTSHPTLLTDQVATWLKQSGCKVVKMGIEAGNPEIRKMVLKRNISDDQIKQVFDVAKRHGLKPQAFNMIGLPGETCENMLETVRLNAAIRPYVVWVSTFNPYPGTELHQLCVDQGLIDESRWDAVRSYRGASVIDPEHLDPVEFYKIHVMFRWFLNADLGNEAEKTYRQNIEELSSLSDDRWNDGTAENLFLERDSEIDEELRKKKIDHYVLKKYINIYWSKEYDYDLS